MDNLSDVKTPSLTEPKISKHKHKISDDKKDIKKVKYLDQLYTKQFIRKYFNEK